MSVTDEIKGKQTLIFTYGTLKRGFANHPLLQDLIRTDDAVYLGSYLTVHELPLVCGPHGVPFLLNLPGSARHRVHGELYAVSDRALARIDELEGTTRSHYERLPIQVRSETEVDGGDGGGVVVEAEAYYAHRSYAEEMWRRNGRVGFSAFTEKEEKGYVKRGDRPKDRSFIEDIQLFVSSSSSPQL
ncbi:putative gamma-glutamylcyclotransferase At3g02910 [Cornus florida]|uniref:putative gamma-glutamylcyclotransferase At3g02910 n=1 Tax=Cornus florida TaxID=4283 RepID=UPI0028981955|nr:putative gamma-glutamylcyclotransferase At3g02910 [Cornus florida]